MMQKEEARQEHVKTLKLLFEAIDTSGDGELSPREVEVFLRDEGKAAGEIKRICKTSIRDVIEVLHSLDPHDGHSGVKVDRFVDYLIDAGNTVTEKSILKLQSRIAALETTFRQEFESLRTTQATTGSSHPSRQVQKAHDGEAGGGRPPAKAAASSDDVACAVPPQSLERHLSSSEGGDPRTAPAEGGLRQEVAEALRPVADVLAAGLARQEAASQALCAQLQQLVDQGCRSREVLDHVHGQLQDVRVEKAIAATLEGLWLQGCSNSDHLSRIHQAVVAPSGPLLEKKPPPPSPSVAGPPRPAGASPSRTEATSPSRGTPSPTSLQAAAPAWGLSEEEDEGDAHEQQQQRWRPSAALHEVASHGQDGADQRFFMGSGGKFPGPRTADGPEEPRAPLEVALAGPEAAAAAGREEPKAAPDLFLGSQSPGGQGGRAGPGSPPPAEPPFGQPGAAAGGGREGPNAALATY